MSWFIVNCFCGLGKNLVPKYTLLYGGWAGCIPPISPTYPCMDLPVSKWLERWAHNGWHHDGSGHLYRVSGQACTPSTRDKTMLLFSAGAPGNQEFAVYIWAHFLSGLPLAWLPCSFTASIHLLPLFIWPMTATTSLSISPWAGYVRVNKEGM